MNKHIILLVLSFIFLFSCKNNDNPNNPTNGVKGNITGDVQLLDESHNLVNDFSGVNISIKGTDFTTQSDSKGKWTLKDIPPGVYDIIMSKPDYDSLLFFGYPFPGNGTAYLTFYNNGVHYATELNTYYYYETWIIAQIPSIKFSDMSITNEYRCDTLINVDSLGHIDTIYRNWYFPISIKSDRVVDITFFLSKDPIVSKYFYENVIYVFEAYSLMKYNQLNKSIDIRFSSEYLKKNYQKGDKVYIIAYPGEARYTRDLRNGYTQWLGLGEPTQVASFIVP